ncbi:MAG: PD-(D/E)XK nuclease family protein [Bacteroidales bacterium]|nr:PD-(D/E)XK nuclease family protein [Bacteroidales bacterium]
MLKLIFSPYYDGNCYAGNPAKQQCVLGTKYVGPLGLLDELELRAGLTGRYSDDFQRAILYARAIKKAIDVNNNLFFAKSFDKDKIKTAFVVLGWRDALVKAGWNKTITGSSRLDGLASVEAFFTEKGEADRWRALLELSRNSALLDKTDSIEVACKKEHLEPLYRQLFDNMEKNDCMISYAPMDIANNLHQKAKVLSFKNDLEMAEWLVQQKLGDNDVVVCDDSSILNLDLALEGKPQVGDESNAIGAVMQIFTLGLQLFNKPLNLNTLLAYLQLPSTPLTSLYVKRTSKKDGTDYYLSLRRVLFEQLLKDNGIGTAWNELIDEAVYDYEGHDMSKSPQRATALLFINQWTKVEEIGDKHTVKKKIVVDFLDAMKKWAKKNLFDESKALQFNAVADNCDIMKMILEDEPNVIGTADLSLWTSQITHPVTLLTLPARVGCINVTRSIADIHTAPDTLYWACTTPQYNFRYDLEFLSPNEISILKQNAIDVLSRETELKAIREVVLGVLSKVKKQILMLECDIIGGNVPVEDPVATELRLTGKFNMKPQAPDLKDWGQNKVMADSTKQGEYKVDSSVFKLLDTEKEKGGLKREMESYSSLDELIQRPFDYVMDYILELHQYGTAAMADMDTVKGNVAHAYVEKLTKDGNNVLADMKNLHSTDFEKQINLLAETQGTILLLEENELEFKRFKTLLKKSVDTLLDIIDQNNLTIVGAEQYYEAEVPTIGKMNARIDYVLADNNGDYVIIDFKWNESTTYQKKLAQNDALQLAVYKAVVEKYLEDNNDKHKVCFMGYYALPRHTLYTVYNNLNHKNIEMVVPGSSNDLMKLATNSYSYRIKQIKSGIIEEGEKLELANLQYVKDSASKQLYPLRGDYNDNTLKTTGYGNKNIVLKGGLE